MVPAPDGQVVRTAYSGAVCALEGRCGKGECGFAGQRGNMCGYWKGFGYWSLGVLSAKKGAEMRMEDRQ